MTLPPYLSRTPPPLNSTEGDENEDEEFGTFVVSSDLGEEVYEAFEKAYTSKGEDNVSEDSGFCMNSCGQTQSPCDISPLSSSYPNKVNGVNEDTPESSVLECHLSEKNSISENITCINEVPLEVSSLPDCERISIEDGGETVQDTENASLYLTCYNAVENSFYSETDLDDNALPSLHDKADSKPSGRIDFLCDFKEPEIIDESNCGMKFISGSAHNIPQISSENIVEDSSHNLCSGPVINSETNVDFEPNSHHFFFHKKNANEEAQGSSANGKCDLDNNDGGSDDDFSEFAEFQSSSDFVGAATEETNQEFDFSFLEETYFEESGDDRIIFGIHSAVQSSIVWNSLQCFEETSACKYQWSTSCTNMKFLKALQIDSRNIFHGPWSKTNKLHWTDVPSHCDTSFRPHDSSSSSAVVIQPIESSIPEAHFDWVTSGLVNPLQPTSNQHYTTELLERNSPDVLTTAKSELLASLPSLSFIKAHYIVFKRD